MAVTQLADVIVHGFYGLGTAPQPLVREGQDFQFGHDVTDAC